MNNLHILLHKIKLHRFDPNGDQVTFLESVKELRVSFSVGSVMIWTIRFHHLCFPKCLDMQDKHEQNCSFSFLGWRIFSTTKFLLWRCLCLLELPSDAAHLWIWMPLVVSAEVDILAPTSLPWQYVLGDYQHCLIKFLAFIGMVNVDLYSSEILLLLLSAVTWSKQCPHHVQHMWFGPPANTRMFSSIIQIHTDLGFICLRNLNLGTSLNFCVRCLLTKCSLIFMITLLFLMTFYFFTFRRIFLSLTVTVMLLQNLDALASSE